MTDYQKQPRHIRLYRWLRYMPAAYARAGFYIGWWMLLGMPLKTFGGDFTRCETLKIAWKCHVNMAHHKMGNSWSLNEVMESLR